MPAQRRKKVKWLSKIEDILSDILKALDQNKKEKTRPYDTTATVTRVEGSTAYVHIPGGVDETPVTMSINCKTGDTVNVRVSGGRAWITGNSTAPPTDDRVANTAIQTSSDATKSANNAGKAASAAQAAAEAAQGDIDEQKNYFWKDNEGAHILSEEEGKKINVTSDGIEVVSAKDSNTLMNVSSSKGVYFDENIPVTIGNDNANIKYYDSDNDGKADAISITASSIIFASSGESVETSISEAKDTANNSVKSLVTEYASNQSSVIAPTEGEGWSSASPERKDGYYVWQRTVTKTSHDTIYSDPVCITGSDGKDAVLLIIESSNGTMFKNTSIATNLTVTVIVGGKTITDSKTMKETFGDTAFLTWKQKEMGTSIWTELSTDDSRLSDNGFIMTLTADDISEKTVFQCNLDY